MDRVLALIVLALALLFLCWLFFYKGTGLPPETQISKRTPEELAAEREQREREREQERLDQIEKRRQDLEEKRVLEETERRRSLEEATRRTLEEDERRRRLSARAAGDSAVGREFARYIAAPVPSEIKRSMQAFLAGEFVGADRSPLAYVGYRVGKTNGLTIRDRERRLLVCFRIDIPRELRGEYSGWAGPGSSARLNSMRHHIQKLAAMRRDRPGYEVAVSQWHRDAEWLGLELSGLAERFSMHGVTW